MQTKSADRKWNETLDGKVVLEHVNPDGAPGPTYLFEFSVQKYAHPEPGGAAYFGVTPYRAIIWTGGSPEEVIASMLHELATLGRSGALNPGAPHGHGSPPIQHAIHFLTERLLWQVQQRREHLDWADQAPESKPGDGALAGVARDNEIVAALATSIAALARVKDL
jgi:hypothetical protein